MPRGFQKNEPATREALATGFLQDKRSFISQSKAIKGECDEAIPHLILYGRDKGPIRAEIFKEDRAFNGGVNRCWNCKREVTEDSGGRVERMRGEWDHVRNKPGTRCDCPENGRVACRNCHSERHPKPQFGKSKS
jgi:hypothetical protein